MLKTEKAECRNLSKKWDWFNSDYRIIFKACFSRKKMAELVYTIIGQVHGFNSREVTKNVFKEAVRRVQAVKRISDLVKSSENVSYDIPNGEFAGVNYAHEEMSIDIGKARNKHTSKGKEVDLIKFACSDIEKLEEIVKIFGLE